MALFSSPTGNPNLWGTDVQNNGRNPILDEIDSAAQNAHAQLSPQAQEAIRRSGAPVPGQPAADTTPRITNPKPSMAMPMPAESTAPMASSVPDAITAPHATAAPVVAPEPLSPAGTAAQGEFNRITAPDTGVHDKTNTGTSGINQIHNPVGRISLQVLQALGQGFAPGLTAAIPGTDLHHQMLVRQQEGNVAEQELERTHAEQAGTAAATQEHLEGETEHNLAQAEALRNPKVTPEKEDVHAIYAEAVRDAMKRGVDPGSDPKVQQTLAAVTALNKEPNPPKSDIHVLLADAIKDAQDRGVDPAGDPHVSQITAAIRATANAPNETEVIHKQVSGKPHNVMVKKGTGEVVADLGELGEKEPAGETGTSTLEELNGKPVFVNNKTQRITPAPEGLAKAGTAEKAEAAVKPIKDAVTFGRTYLDSGQFNGAEDEALINKAAGLMTVGITKRAPSPAQQKIIMESRSAMQGAAAIAKHYINPQAPWLDDTTRQNLVKTMEDIAKSEGLEAPATGGGASGAPRVQQNSKGEFRYSTDGGKTWQAGKPK